jgi:hypothetical protein
VLLVLLVLLVRMRTEAKAGGGRHNSLMRTVFLRISKDVTKKNMKEQSGEE